MTASSANATPRLIRACKGEVLDRPPVWLMRQAGRYMPEYRAIREKVSFLELCKSPDLAAEVSLQPYHSFGMDGVIMFSDILIPPEAMGMEVTFGDGGPTFTRPLQNAADIDRLIIPDPVEKTGFVMEILRKLRAALASDPETALIGFAGSPWTLATYMIEGGASKHFARIKGLMYEQPEALHRLLDKLSRTVTLYLNAQIEAGAQVVQLFDTWAGILSAEEYREFVLPYHQQIIDGLNREHAPVILYVNNSRGLLPLMAEAKPDVIGVDHLTAIPEARKLVGPHFALQGNLDPVALFSPPDVLLPKVNALLEAGGRQGFVFNLGHGILPATPVENVRLLVNQVKASATQGAALTHAPL
ncbi:MAG TPA: uroporphyrinogen decarboxylase [Coleofasciculaceae cyanobacterium]